MGSFSVLTEKPKIGGKSRPTRLDRPSNGPARGVPQARERNFWTGCVPGWAKTPSAMCRRAIGTAHWSGGENSEAEVRLGLRMISGLAEAETAKLLEARAQAPFEHFEDFAKRSRLSRRALLLVARGGALAGLAGHRRAAFWSAIGVEQLPGVLAGHSAKEDSIRLRAPTEGEELVADYRSLGLTLGRHPLALLRAKLDRLKVHRATDLAAISHRLTSF